MKTATEALKDNKVKLTVTIDSKEIDERIKKTYKDFAHKYTFPGFRKGKAPRPIIDNALGAEAVIVTVTDDVINENYPKAIDENDLYPVARPEFENSDTLVEEGKNFSFVATVEVKPEFELSSYEPVEIEMPSGEATEEEIDEQINALRDYYFTLEDAAASAKIAEDSYVDVSIKATDDKGTELEGLTTESRTFGLGLGAYPVAFDKELIGMKKGQKKSFDVNMSDEDAKILGPSADGNEKIHFDVEVLGVKKKVLPELNDEWTSEMGFETVEQLREGVKDSINQQKGGAIVGLKEDKSLSQLASRLKGEVPESLVEEAQQRLMSNFFQQLQSQSMTLDMYLKQQGITSDQFKDDVKQQATEIAKQDLALDAWARNAGMKVTGKDITEEFVQSGAENPKELEAQWRENGQIYIIKEGILRSRATKEVLDTAIVKPLDEKKPAKKETKTTAKKTSAKKDAEGSETKKPAAAAKKATTKKPAAKKASDK